MKRASSNVAMSSDEIVSMFPSAASPPMTSTNRTTAELAKRGLRSEMAAAKQVD